MKNTKRAVGFAYYYSANKGGALRYFPDNARGRADAIDYSDIGDTVRVGGFAVIDDDKPGVVSEIYASLDEANAAAKKNNKAGKSRKDYRSESG